MPAIQLIRIYPIKALDGMAVESATIIPGGGLRHDREYRIVDAEGTTVNGKRTAAVTRLRSDYDLAGGTITVGRVEDSERQTFHLQRDRAALEAWLTDYFGFAVSLQHNTDTGFPDDPDLHGPTLVGRGTLAQVGDWFGGEWSLEHAVRRFRTNLVLDTDEPWWEDRLHAERGEYRAFSLGGVTMWGVKPCFRCIVPTRDPYTGEFNRNFQREFCARRADTVGPESGLSWFNQSYYLSLNTHVPPSEAGKTLRVGDTLAVGDAATDPRFAMYVK